MRRWVCPTCQSGVLAPERPRRDDVRRYCLDCSATAGRLVERTAPSLERQRAINAEARRFRSTAAKVTAARRAREAHMIGTVDLLAEARRFWRLTTLAEARRATWRTPGRVALPTIEWRRDRTGMKSHTSGVCWTQHQRIVITIGYSPAEAVEVVLHELVHAALPLREKHGPLFRSTLASAAREAYPTVDFAFHEMTGREAYWALDQRIAVGILDSWQGPTTGQEQT